MNVSDGIAVINNHGFADTDDTQKMWAINDALWEADGMENWPYLYKSANLNFDGTNPYPSNIPSDLGKVQWMTRLSDGQPIFPERIETARMYMQQNVSSTGAPQFFYFMGTQLRFWPTPTAGNAQMLLDYRAVQPILNSGSLEASILMPPRFHTIWVYGALIRLYNADDDPELAAVKKQEYEERIQKMRSDLFPVQNMRADKMYTLDPDEIGVDTYWIP